MTKFCSNCGMEINSNADVCVHCGKDLNVLEGKKSNKKVIIIVISILLFLIVFTFVMVALFVHAVITEYNNIDINTSDLDDIFEFDWYTIGETINYKNVNIKLENAYIYDYLGEGASAEVPSEKHEYLIFFFDANNVRPTSYNFDLNKFVGYVDGKQVNVSNLSNKPDGYSPFDGVIEAGMKRKGYVAFEVNKNWSNFELNYVEDNDRDKFIFKILNDDDTSEFGINF